jgi:hypothetical protein
VRYRGLDLRLWLVGTTPVSVGGRRFLGGERPLPLARGGVTGTLEYPGGRLVYDGRLFVDGRCMLKRVMAPAPVFGADGASYTRIVTRRSFGSIGPFGTYVTGVAANTPWLAGPGPSTAAAGRTLSS